MSFVQYVGIETITRARFNYWEPSFALRQLTPPGIAYHTYISEANLNLVVIELTQTTDRRRTEWYFGIFQGKPIKRCQDEEIQQFFDRVYAIATRRNRIAGRDLEAAINRTLDGICTNPAFLETLSES